MLSELVWTWPGRGEPAILTAMVSEASASGTQQLTRACCTKVGDSSSSDELPAILDVTTHWLSKNHPAASQSGGMTLSQRCTRVGLVNAVGLHRHC